LRRVLRAGGQALVGRGFLERRVLLVRELVVLVDDALVAPPPPSRRFSRAPFCPESNHPRALPYSFGAAPGCTMTSSNARPDRPERRRNHAAAVLDQAGDHHARTTVPRRARLGRPADASAAHGLPHR